MRISVVIPHLNQPEFLDRCLTSLAEGRRVPDEVVVVDNGSVRMPEEVCAAHPGTILLKESEAGPGPARNLGVAHTKGDVLAFIDADCRADPNWLAAAEAKLADPAISILGGDVRIGCDNPGRPTITEAYESIFAYRMDRYIAQQGFTGTGNLVVRRAVLDEVGPFAGISVAEDRDWGQRASSKGHDIHYLAAMRVYHPARPRFVDLFAKWDRHLAHDYHRACEKAGGRLRWALKTLAMAPSSLVEVPQILFSDRISGGRARVLAFVGLARVRILPGQTHGPVDAQRRSRQPVGAMEPARQRKLISGSDQRG